jgi:hypothetical protein
VSLVSHDGKTLYYTKGAAVEEPLYAQSIIGDDEERLVMEDRVAFRGFAIFHDGAFYIVAALLKNTRSDFSTSQNDVRR